jgi:YD repeat-containing protein
VVYSYDAENRLTKVSDWTGAVLLQNTYDGLGRCVKRDRHDWGTFVELIAYDGWKPIVEWDGAGKCRHGTYTGRERTKSCGVTRAVSDPCVTITTFTGV